MIAVMETGRWVLGGDGRGGGMAVMVSMGSGAADSGDCGLEEFSEVGKSGAHYP